MLKKAEINRNANFSRELIMKTADDVISEIDRTLDHWEETDPLWDLKLAYIRCKLVPFGSRHCGEWIGIIRQVYREATFVINHIGTTLN